MRISTQKHGYIFINGYTQEKLYEMLSEYGPIGFIDRMCKERRVTKDGQLLKQY